MHKSKILVFGNLLVEKDNIPIKLIPRLQKNFPKIEFIEAEATEEIQNYGKNLLIIDIVPPKTVCGDYSIIKKWNDFLFKATGKDTKERKKEFGKIKK